ncbi:XRE family transcriptional regulator [Avibacterium paragallinarum]|uniref:XRE family transcriptional regulator n=1 Tax=Avibacterium paragallinarum TaxID=728 RepID=UPI0039861D40
MTTLGKRIERVMIERGMSREKLASALGISTMAVGNLINDKTKKPRNLVEIADVLEVDPKWLMNGSQADNSTSQTIGVNLLANRASDFQIEHLTNIEASAGYGVVGGDTYNAVELIQFSEEQYTMLFSNTRAEFIKIINVRGDSMSPTFESGDLLYIDTRVNHYDGDGIYVFIYSGYRHVKRLQMAGSKLLVLSDNPAYKEWDINQSNEDEFFVEGKVLVSQSQAIKRFG